MNAPGIDHRREAERILDAHARGITLTPISDRASIDLDDAYLIQQHVTDARLTRGERRIGWKLGYTSIAMRMQMGIDAPNFGPLTDAMLLDDGGTVATLVPTTTQPRVEPEVALRFGNDVEPGADREGVLAAVASAHACLEIVDSVWSDYRFRIEDNTADGSSAAGVVVGPSISLDAIAEVEVRLFVDGDAVGMGRGEDAGGHPADGVVWLVGQLAARGERVRAGDVVITGGLTAAVALDAGSMVHATFEVVPPVVPVRVSVVR